MKNNINKCQQKQITLKPGFQLNCHDRGRNPLFESHDPSMMKDPVSGIYYSYSTDSAITSEYKQGIGLRKSMNLVDFTYVGTVLSEESVKEARDNGLYGQVEGFWAPFTEYVDGEYHMYYSATKAFGSSESKIWMAAAKHPEGPFYNKGVVMDTWFTDNTFPNGIDPHIIDDLKGRKYLVYGSFFGGIYCKELNASTGMPLDGNARNLGKRIAIKPQNAKIDGPEGAAVIYNEFTGYYYLFLSYGWLGEDYDIRVGRAKQVLGPYFDYDGKDMNGEGYGLKLANSYLFRAVKPYAETLEKWTYGGFRAPGHGVPFVDCGSKEFFFIHHIRDGAKELKVVTPNADHEVSYRMHYMVVRRMLFIKDWPVLSPEPYAGEAMREYSMEELRGEWEWILMDDSDNRIKMSTISLLDGEEKEGAILPCFDFENSRAGICMTGIQKDGIAFWGKKVK